MTPLSFGFNVSILGPYIASALGSLLPYILITLGLVIGAAILFTLIKWLHIFGRINDRTMPCYHTKDKPLYFSMMNKYHKGG